MLLSEFISILQSKMEQHGDVEVVATYEGLIKNFSKQHMNLDEKFGLVIDVEVT